MDPFRPSKMRMTKLADENFDRVIKLKHAAMSLLQSETVEIDFPLPKEIQIPILAGQLTLVFSLPRSELTEFLTKRGEAPSLQISVQDQDDVEVLRVIKQAGKPQISVYEPGLWEDALLARAAHGAESVQTPESDFADMDLLARLYGAALALLRNEASLTCDSDLAPDFKELYIIIDDVKIKLLVRGKDLTSCSSEEDVPFGICITNDSEEDLFTAIRQETGEILVPIYSSGPWEKLILSRAAKFYH